MSTYKLITRSEIHFDETKVLAPDPVTEELAVEAARMLIGRVWAGPTSILELGVGTGAFSRIALDLARTRTDITAIDIDPDAIETAQNNIEGHRKLGQLALIQDDWANFAFDEDSYDIIYFNPPYLPTGAVLRDEFKTAPEAAVYADGAQDIYLELLPKIVRSLRIGGAALIRYPGDGSLTYAGSDATRDHSPWMTFEQLDRVGERLVRRGEWLRQNLPDDTRSYMWRSAVAGRRVNAEIFARIGDSILNAPLLIQQQEAYWTAMNAIYDERERSSETEADS